MCTVSIYLHLLRYHCWIVYVLLYCLEGVYAAPKIVVEPFIKILLLLLHLSKIEGLLHLLTMPQTKRVVFLTSRVVPIKGRVQWIHPSKSLMLVSYFLLFWITLLSLHEPKLFKYTSPMLQSRSWSNTFCPIALFIIRIQVFLITANHRSKGLVIELLPLFVVIIVLSWCFILIMRIFTSALKRWNTFIKLLLGWISRQLSLKRVFCLLLSSLELFFQFYRFLL